MTPVLAGLVGLAVGSAVAMLAVLWLHERREFRKQDRHERFAQEREEKAVARHDAQMAALKDARSLTLAAVNQRGRLEARAAALEAALNDHAEHLAALGRVRPYRVKPGGEG
jgi:biopolymer transport protein ExbB/TolQ